VFRVGAVFCGLAEWYESQELSNGAWLASCVDAAPTSRSPVDDYRGPGATPAGHVSLPTHREVVAAAYRISALGAPHLEAPRLPCVLCCVSAFHAAAIDHASKGSVAITQDVFAEKTSLFTTALQQKF
jgi:hypothetical protein